MATANADIPFAAPVVVCSRARSPERPNWSRPAFCSAPTITKSPATKNNTDQDAPFATLSGMLGFRQVTTAIARTAAQHVGRPSDRPNADDVTRAAAAMANPKSASFPSTESDTGFDSTCISPRSSSREAHRKQRKVTEIETAEGRRKICNHLPSGGMCWSKTIRLAGFEIGKTKLAALAMNAQARR